MLMTAIEIRRIRKEEIPLIREFPPTGWNTDLEKVCNLHYDQDYFYPVVAVMESEIAGTGMAIFHENAAWLGNIIVRECYRNKGIGNSITKHLIDFSLTNGTDTVLLTASEPGLPIYIKLGFQHDTSYLFFKTDNLISVDSVNKNISQVLKDDYDNIFELDHHVTGEKREKILATALDTGFKYRDGKIEGYYLPDFGKGLIIADSGVAGIELLKFRFSRDQSPVCIPESNKAAIELVSSLGFYEYLKIPRMFLNKNVNWHPEKVYSRGCGYMG